MSDIGDAVLTQRQAADFLKLSARTLERMRQTGGGPRFATAGARIIYRRVDIDKWLESRVVASTSEATVRDRKAA